jgi:hypothetical protein
MKNKIIMRITLFLMFPFTVSASLTPISEEFDLYEEMSVVEEQQEDIYTVPILGEVDARNVSLPILAMVMGAVDGFNPCAMWILIFLITMLLNIPDKRKRWVLGLAFILTSGVVYLFLMLAWLNVAVYVAQIHLIRLVISIFAIGFGMFSLYKYVKSLQETEVGCDVTTQKQRNKIMQKIRKVVSQKSFALAVIGIIAVSASVNLLEALCSLGLPLIFTQILAINELTSLQHAFYIGLYILFFVLNELIIFVIAMVTMNIKGISNKYAKYSNLIGGIIMLLLGLLMALRPEWLMFSF